MRFVQYVYMCLGKQTVQSFKYFQLFSLVHKGVFLSIAMVQHNLFSAKQYSVVSDSFGGIGASPVHVLSRAHRRLLDKKMPKVITPHQREPVLRLLKKLTLQSWAQRWTWIPMRNMPPQRKSMLRFQRRGQQWASASMALGTGQIVAPPIFQVFCF